MAALEAEIAELDAKMAEPGFYGADPKRFNETAGTADAKRAELAALEEEWLELEMLREEIEG